MTADERRTRIDALRPYIADLAARMGLAHWRMCITDDLPDDRTHAAEHAITHKTNEATIRIGDATLAFTADELREVLVHELLHCHFRLLKEAWWDLDHLVGKPVYEVLSSRFYDGEEFAVDAISRFLAPFLPLPPPPPRQQGRRS